MCGIAGVISCEGGSPIDRAALARMCATLVHRGPDEDGLDVQGGVALGMRRLSIIDVADGHQPYVNEDRTVRCVFNGEIYNFRELREDLARRGHRFNSGADGEVLVHLWEEHGPACVEHLNGMFAIALHDARTGRALLARDPIGIKPLYYCHHAGDIVFGSEIKALLALDRVPRRLDIDQLGQFIDWEYVPAPGTLFRDIRKLPAAHRLEIDLRGGAVVLTRYWDALEAAGQLHLEPSGAALDDQVDHTIHAAVRRQLVSDVPLGAFLSGGVDSSLIVAAMGPARTFSIGFDDPTYNELAWSRRVADHLGVDHHTEIIRPHVADLFSQLMHYMDDPIGDFSIFPTYLVSRLARRQVTVVLSGDGGDELFGGYETYVAELHARRWARLPAWLRQRCIEPLLRCLPPRPKKKGLINKARRFAEGLQHDAGLGHARWRLFAGAALRHGLFTADARAAMATPSEAHVLDLARRARAADPVTRGLYVDLNSYLVDNCLLKVDRMSMACSLEARVPLLDRDVTALAFALPPEHKVHGGTTKPLLKRVAARHVPADCVYRAKEGFSIPIKHWLKTDFRPLLDDLLAPGLLAGEGLFDVATVSRLKAEHLADRANHSHVLWALLVFQDWRRRWRV